MTLLFRRIRIGMNDSYSVLINWLFLVTSPVTPAVGVGITMNSKQSVILVSCNLIIPYNVDSSLSWKEHEKDVERVRDEERNINGRGRKRRKTND